MGLFDAFRHYAARVPDAHGALGFSLDSAAYTYENGKGIRPLNLSLTPTDRRVAIIGLNGSGKTTLLKLLDGTASPTRGRVRVSAGTVVMDTADKAQRRQITSLVGRIRRDELPESFFRAPSVADALSREMKRRHMRKEGATAADALARFGLAPVFGRPVAELDGERRHLLAIATAVAVSTATLLADEPTKGLDEIATADVAGALFATGRQVVFVTHDLTIVTKRDYHIDRVLLLDDGALVADGSAEKVVERYRTRIAEVERQEDAER